MVGGHLSGNRCLSSEGERKNLLRPARSNGRRQVIGRPINNTPPDYLLLLLVGRLFISAERATGCGQLLADR